MTTTIDISIITVNYNTGDLISTCIESLLAQRGLNYEIIVVDNASHDDSVKVIKYYQPQIKLIESSDNLGFGKANNLAAANAQGKYLYLLNPDAFLQNPNDLKALYEYMETHPDIGLAGTPLLDSQENNEGLPKNAYPDQQHLQYPLNKLEGTIAWVIGASMMIKRDLYQQIKGFDEDYFLYGEEADLCLRVREAGFRIGYCDTVPVFHLGGGSERKTSHYQLTLKKQNGLHLFYQKHYHKQDVRNLLRKNLRRARLRLCSNRLNYFFTHKSRYKNKYERYRAIVESSKQALARL